MVLQSKNEQALSLSLLVQVQTTAESIFGQDHIQNAQALNQLTQAYFLSNDIPNALATSQAAHEIFKNRYGDEHPQTKETGRNIELLTLVVENAERQKMATQQAKERQVEKLQAARARLSPSIRGRMAGIPSGASAGGSAIAGTSAAGAAAAQVEQEVREASRIGERGHLDIDELVKFVDGSPNSGAKRGKNALRGKRRTGAKR
jgi:protein TIF31